MSEIDTILAEIHSSLIFYLHESIAPLYIAREGWI